MSLDICEGGICQHNVSVMSMSENGRWWVR